MIGVDGVARVCVGKRASMALPIMSEDTRKCVVSASRLARDFGDKILTLEVGISMCDRELSRFGEVLEKL